MNKLATFGIATLLALSVAACNQNDTAAEFKKFQEWSVTQEQARNQAQIEFQKQFGAAMNANNPQALEAAAQTYITKINDSLKSLEALDVKSDDVKMLKEKAKVALTTTIQSLPAQMQLLIATPEQRPAIEQQLQAQATNALKAIDDLKSAENALKSKLNIK